MARQPKKQQPTKPAPKPLATADLAAQALASQSRPASIAANLDEAQQTALAATMTPDGLATAKTAEVVRTVVAAYYESQKATVDEESPPFTADAPPAEPEVAAEEPTEVEEPTDVAAEASDEPAGEVAALPSTPQPLESEVTNGTAQANP